MTLGETPKPPAQPVTSAPLVVVLPVYNEGENLRDWYAHASQWLPAGAEVRVVYDFDEDNTLPVARELLAKGAPIALLKNRARGVLNALITGLRSVDRGPVLVSMADLSDDFSVLPEMLAQYAAGARVVVASRYMPGGQLIDGNLIKRTLGRWGSLALHRFADFPTRDATNSFRLYDAELLGAMEFESRGGFEIGFEITLKAWMAGAKVVELPTTWRDRSRGESRFALREWLPRYASLWARAMRYGLSKKRQGRA